MCSIHKAPDRAHSDGNDWPSPAEQQIIPLHPDGGWMFSTWLAHMPARASRRECVSTDGWPQGEHRLMLLRCSERNSDQLRKASMCRSKPPAFFTHSGWWACTASRIDVHHRASRRGAARPGCVLVCSAAHWRYTEKSDQINPQSRRPRRRYRDLRRTVIATNGAQSGSAFIFSSCVALRWRNRAHPRLAYTIFLVAYGHMKDITARHDATFPA